MPPYFVIHLLHFKAALPSPFLAVGLLVLTPFVQVTVATDVRSMIHHQIVLLLKMVSLLIELELLWGDLHLNTLGRYFILCLLLVPRPASGDRDHIVLSLCRGSLADPVLEPPFIILRVIALVFRHFSLLIKLQQESTLLVHVVLLLQQVLHLSLGDI